MAPRVHVTLTNLEAEGLLYLAERGRRLVEEERTVAVEQIGQRTPAFHVDKRSVDPELYHSALVAVHKLESSYHGKKRTR